MEINQAEFLCSNTDYKLCPDANKPEYAFIGRSNVGKSSLINMLTNRKKLAKTSSTPGKTQLINHFLIDEAWYLVDLPGYGYARVSKKERGKWEKFIQDYLLNRENLVCVFVLLDSRIEAQKIDLEFMEWLGVKGIPFAMVFTKTDKLPSHKLNKNLKAYQQRMLKRWDALPGIFTTSSESKQGKIELLSYINDLNKEVEF